jgi:hypothetical protein
MGAQLLVARLFESLDEHSVAQDSTVLDYVAGVLLEYDSLEADELRYLAEMHSPGAQWYGEHVWRRSALPRRDLLEGFSLRFAGLKYEEQNKIVEDLLREASKEPAQQGRHLVACQAGWQSPRLRMNELC